MCLMRAGLTRLRSGKQGQRQQKGVAGETDGQQPDSSHTNRVLKSGVTEWKTLTVSNSAAENRTIHVEVRFA